MTLPIHPELGSEFSYETAMNEFGWALNGTHSAPSAQPIVQQVIQLGALLLKKNKAYGDSALSPLDVFITGLAASEKMAVRIDDKLSRISRGLADGEDPEMDLAGYLVLRRIAQAAEKSAEVPF